MKILAWILLGANVTMAALSFAGMLYGNLSTLLGVVVIVVSVILSIKVIRQKPPRSSEWV